MTDNIIDYDHGFEGYIKCNSEDKFFEIVKENDKIVYYILMYFNMHKLSDFFAVLPDSIFNLNCYTTKYLIKENYNILVEGLGSFKFIASIDLFNQFFVSDNYYYSKNQNVILYKNFRINLNDNPINDIEMETYNFIPPNYIPTVTLKKHQSYFNLNIGILIISYGTIFDGTFNDNFFKGIIYVKTDKKIKVYIGSAIINFETYEYKLQPNTVVYSQNGKTGYIFKYGEFISIHPCGHTYYYNKHKKLYKIKKVVKNIIKNIDCESFMFNYEKKDIYTYTDNNLYIIKRHTNETIYVKENEICIHETNGDIIIADKFMINIYCTISNEIIILHGVIRYANGDTFIGVIMQNNKPYYGIYQKLDAPAQHGYWNEFIK